MFYILSQFTNFSGNSGYLSAYKRAQLTYERLKAERREHAERERAERERQREEMQFNKEWRKKLVDIFESMINRGTKIIFKKLN